MLASCTYLDSYSRYSPCISVVSQCQSCGKSHLLRVALGIGFSFYEKLPERGYIVYATAHSVESIRALQVSTQKQENSLTQDELQVHSVVQTLIDNERRLDMVINKRLRQRTICVPEG